MSFSCRLEFLLLQKKTCEEQIEHRDVLCEWYWLKEPRWERVVHLVAEILPQACEEAGNPLRILQTIAKLRMSGLGQFGRFRPANLTAHKRILGPYHTDELSGRTYATGHPHDRVLRCVTRTEVHHIIQLGCRNEKCNGWKVPTYFPARSREGLKKLQTFLEKPSKVPKCLLCRRMIR